MGTLGCINDMLQRDKENRALRQRNRERVGNTRERLIDARCRNATSQRLTHRQMEHIAQEAREREQWESRSYLRGTLLFITAAVILTILAAMSIRWLAY